MLELDTPRARCPSQLECRCGRADEYDSQAGEDAALVQEEAAQDELVRELWKGPPDHVVDLPKLPEPEAVRELERERRGLGLELRLPPDDPRFHLRLRVDRNDLPDRLPRGNGLALAIQTRIELPLGHLRRAAREHAGGEQGHDGGLIAMVNPHGEDIDAQGGRLDPVRCQNSADRLGRPPFVVVEDATQPFMTHEGGIHVDRAMPFLDQPAVESLMIALEVVVVGVFLHSVA
jgi:hypothetical protein